LHLRTAWTAIQLGVVTSLGGVVIIIKKIGLGNCIKNEWVARERETVAYTAHARRV
jgi:hypothetical protein